MSSYTFSRAKNNVNNKKKCIAEHQKHTTTNVKRKTKTTTKNSRTFQKKL
jgi:hypothetical protein